jgi:hypothetical protein
MASTRFKLPIGAKRQVTLPRGCMDMLAVHEGSELLLEVIGDHATLRPMVSVVRSELPSQLRRKFLARRGKKSSDISLGVFLEELSDKVGSRRRAASQEKRPSGVVRRQAQTA